MKRMTLILLLSLSAGTISASSEEYHKPISLTPFVGVHSGWTFGRLSPLAGTADVPGIEILRENRGPTVGISLGYLITKRIELQGTLAYGRSEIIEDVGIGLAGVPIGKMAVSDAEAFSYTGNILYHIPLNRLSFYLTAGLGGMNLSIDRFNSRTKLLLNYGLGMKFKLGKHIHPTVDIRDYVSFFNYGEDFEVLFPAIYALDFNESQHHLGIHLGLSWHF